MVFGACCIFINDRIKSMNTKSVKINGFQHGLLVNFEVTQTFYHTEKEAKEVSYIFPNDLKICIYDTTFVVGDEIIKPKLKSKDEAEKTYKEAVESGHTAVLGTNIGYGMTQFKLGNVQPEIECKVILKLAFTGQVTKSNAFFVKFPIDVYTPSGSFGCLDVNASQFNFQIQSDSEKVTKVTSNVKNAKFDDVTKIFSISDKIENEQNEKSIILTFETKDTIQSSCIISPTDSVNYDGCIILISPNLPPSEDTNHEFIFVVDCSGSMEGTSIKNASQCLELFIKSLPSDSYFNVVRFGSTYKKLFENSVLYDDQSSEKAIDLASKLDANLGGTNIYSPLENIFSEKCTHGQRQIFIMTDGEIFDVENVLQLISNNSNENRCFTIGIGRGCDAGLVEGMANASGGMSDFVQEKDLISEKVIPQLQSSLHPSVTSLEIHIEGEDNDSFEVSPYPLPSVNANSSTVIYLRQKKRENSFNGGILITGNYGKESIEISIEDVNRLANVEEDKFGCSDGKNIGKAIVPLFAFSFLQKLERKQNVSDQERMKAIEMSISSGVLCRYTGYVGMTEQQAFHKDVEKMFFDYSKKCCRAQLCPMNCCYNAAPPPPMMNCCYNAAPPPMMNCCYNAAPPPMMNCCYNAAQPPMAYSQQFQQQSFANFTCGQSLQQHQMTSFQPFIPPKTESVHESDDKKQGYPTKYDLIQLTRYQKAGGFWENLEAVKSITGIKIDRIDDVNLPDKTIESRCVATILAIAALRTKSSNEKNSWAMIEQKALIWLKKTLPNIDIEQIISKIQSKIY